MYSCSSQLVFYEFFLKTRAGLATLCETLTLEIDAIISGNAQFLAIKLSQILATVVAKSIFLVYHNLEYNRFMYYTELKDYIKTAFALLKTILFRSLSQSTLQKVVFVINISQKTMRFAILRSQVAGFVIYLFSNILSIRLQYGGTVLYTINMYPYMERYIIMTSKMYTKVVLGHHFPGVHVQ